MEEISKYYFQELMSPKKAANELGVAHEHISRLCRDGEIVALKIGKQWVISREALEAYKKKPKNGRGKYDRAKKGLKKTDRG